jgi:hypothetical protein
MFAGAQSIFARTGIIPAVASQYFPLLLTVSATQAVAARRGKAETDTYLHRGKS